VNRASHSFVYLLASQLATWVVTLAVLVVVPDLTGPDGFGEIGFAAIYMGFFTLAASLGTGTYLTRAIARDSSILGRYVYNAVVLKLVSGVLASVLAVVIAVAIGVDGTKLMLVGLGCVTMVFVIVNEVFVGSLAGLERMGRISVWATVQVYVSSVGGILVLLAGGGVVAFSLVLCFASMIPTIANSRVWRWTAGSRQLDFGVWNALVRGGFPLMILGGLILLYGSIDVPILSVLSSDTEVGWYSLAYRIVGIPLFIATVTTTAVFPSISAHGLAIDGEFTRLTNRSLRLVALLSVPASAGIAVLASRIVDLLYDDRYTSVVPIVQILALTVPFTTMGVALGTALIASDRQSRYLVVAAVAAVLNPIASWFAVQWAMDRYDNGAIGTALVTVGTQVLTFGGMVMLRSKGIMDGWTMWYCGRTVLAAGLMAAMVGALYDLPLLLLCAIGGVVYVVASFLLRTVTPADVRGIARALTGAARSARTSLRPDVACSEVSIPAQLAGEVELSQH
jgi:O-antigen/teichoic acid export membrane protein